MTPYSLSTAAGAHTVAPYSVQFEPMNHRSVSQEFFGTQHQVIKQAGEFGRMLARKLGVSALCVAVTVTAR